MESALSSSEWEDQTMREPIIVLGGGPAGSTTATFLARRGHFVLLLEKAVFPRFHVGESLLPLTQRIWDELGIAVPIEKAGFIKKTAGEIRLGHTPRSTKYYSSRMDFSNVPRSAAQEKWWSYQVERAAFDHLLLKNASEQGVRVHEGARVTGVVLEGQPSVSWTDRHGVSHETKASFVVDATGRHALIARRLGLFRKESRYNTSSVFAHFRNVKWPEGPPGGFINVYMLQDGWIWFIPQSQGITSVGIVMNKEGTQAWPRKPSDVLRDVIGRYDYLRERFESAVQVSPARILRNLPYHAEKLHGKGWALVGDAGFFVDPIHSSGVHLAFYGAKALAEAIDASFQGDSSALDRYQALVRRHHQIVRYNVSLYYRVVVRYRIMALLFIRGTGELFNNWSGPWLKRINAWSFGHYGRYLFSLSLLWGLANIGRAASFLWYGLTGRPRWGRHGYPAAQARPIDIPIIENDQTRLGISPHEADGHMDPFVEQVHGKGDRDGKRTALAVEAPAMKMAHHMRDTSGA